jgi:tetratricopeptide (TPR) repeat protein
VAAGTYSLSMIPNKGAWTVILNTKTDMWGVDGYSQEEDVLRTDVTPQAIAPVETMRLSLENISVSKAEIVLDWSDVRIALPVELNTMELAMANIDAAIAAEPENWRVYRNAANFYNQNNIELAKALTYMEKVIELNPDNWYNYYLYAQVLAKNDRKKEAKKAANKALEMGRADAAKNNAPFNYAETIKRFVSDL